MTVRLSTTVMAHPKRRAWVPGLVAALDGDVQVVWDEGWNDRHRTGMLAIETYDRDATHHLVVQDDVLVCRDLLAGLHAALQHVPDGTPVGLHIGQVRPSRNRTRYWVDVARQAGTPWVEAPGPWWGQGVVYPTATIPDLLGFYRKSDVPNYDKRVATFYSNAGVRCWYTVPSLVEHRHGGTNPSLVPRRAEDDRRAWWFAGEDTSALDLHWHRPPHVTS